MVWCVPDAGEIHLWRACLDVAPDVFERLRTGLSPDELERSTRFRFDLDRARFVAARGWLRMLLARYLDCGPLDLALTAGPHGKPQLGPGRCWVRFNVSHSNGVAVYAIARDREVGVDIEQIRLDLPLDEIARHFSRLERANLAVLPEPDRSRAAFHLWAHKEAFLKALGVGLTRPLDASGASTLGWSVHAFDAGTGYAAAVAVEGACCQVPAEAESVVSALGM